MSNLIKYTFVDLKDKEARVIGYEKEDEKFKPLKDAGFGVQPDKDAVKIEGITHSSVTDMNFEEVFAQKKAEAERTANRMVDDAMLKAATILGDAQKQAEELKQQALEEGRAQGKEEGLSMAQDELEEIRLAIQKERSLMKQEHQQMIADVEVKYVDIMCSLIHKLTGVLLVDKKDVILHLVRGSIADMEPAKKYLIRVCAEDALFLEGNKNELLNKVGPDATIEIQEEKGLEKNECIIETDKQMIDCGFKTQLSNMLTTLRMLA